MKFDPKKHLFVFTHIPKCGGTSVHDCLTSMLKEKYVVISPDYPMNNIDKHIWGIGGHFNFGGVYPKILDGRCPIYMTILRHPWSRFVSYFNHVAVRVEHLDHKCIPNFNELRPIDVLHKWKNLGNRNISNLQTQMICNNNPEKATATKAIDIINRYYKFISTLDHLNEILDEVATFFNIKRQPIKKLNVRKHQNIINSVDDNLYNEVIELNHKDLLLYQNIASKIK